MNALVFQLQESRKLSSIKNLSSVLDVLPKDKVEEGPLLIIVMREDEISVSHHTVLPADGVEGDGTDGNVTVKDWLEEGKKKLDTAREALRYLCDPVDQPRQVEQLLRYFCGDANDPNALDETEQLRISFNKAVGTYLRAYAAMASDLVEAGYSDAEITTLQSETTFFTDIRNAIKRHSGEELDIKPYEAEMRHLINTDIQADQAEDLGHLDTLSLTELIIETGIHDAIAKKLNEKGKLSKNAVAESIINNVRKTIIREQLTDPRFYAEISQWLDDLIVQKQQETIGYKELLNRAEALVRRMGKGHADSEIPAKLQANPEAIAVYRNLPESLFESATPVGGILAAPEISFRDERLTPTLKIDRAMREKAPAGWKGDETREREVLNALFPLLNRDRDATQAIFHIIKNQPGY